MSQWCRLWEDMPNDPKFRVVAKRAGRPVSEVLAVFVHMMTNAANATERGHLDGWHDDAIAIAIDAEPDHVAAIRTAMQGWVLDGDRLSGWEKRQPRREDGSAERAKAWREAKRAEAKGGTPLLDEIERTRTLEAEAEQKREEAGKPASAQAREPAASPPLAEDLEFQHAATAALGAGRVKGSFAPMLAIIADRERIVDVLRSASAGRAKPIGSWELAATVAAEGLAAGRATPGQGARASPAAAGAPVFTGRKVNTPLAGPLAEDFLRAEHAAGRWRRSAYGPPPGEPGSVLPALSLEAAE